jgi:hypothetical protein
MYAHSYFAHTESKRNSFLPQRDSFMYKKYLGGSDDSRLKCPFKVFDLLQPGFCIVTYFQKKTIDGNGKS